VTLSIELPWPHKALWPNGRAHWRTKASQTAKHRQWGYIGASAAIASARGLPPRDERVCLTLTFYPKPRGPAPDRDNALGSCKAYLDGIAQAMGVNDRNFDARVIISDVRSSKIIVEIA